MKVERLLAQSCGYDPFYLVPWKDCFLDGWNVLCFEGSFGGLLVSSFFACSCALVEGIVPGNYLVSFIFFYPRNFLV